MNVFMPSQDNFCYLVTKVFDQNSIFGMKTDLIGMTCLSFSSCSNISAREVSRAAINLIEPFTRFMRTELKIVCQNIRPMIPALKFILHGQTGNHLHCQIMNFIHILISNLNLNSWSLTKFRFQMLLPKDW